MNSTSNRLSESLQCFERCRRAGKMAHAYIIDADPRGAGTAWAKGVAQRLMCTSDHPPCGRCSACRRVEHFSHANILVIEPVKKSRVIGVEAMRETLKWLASSAFEGGWKMLIIFDADRMNDQSANAFLKTLEEPPPQTMMLLLTQAPHALLPTIKSRCQTISLPEPQLKQRTDWSEPLNEMLAAKLCSPLDATRLAGQLMALLSGIRSTIESEEKQHDDDIENDVAQARIESSVRKTRAEIMRYVLLWQRDLLLLALHSPQTAIFHSDMLPALTAQSANMTVFQGQERIRQTEEMMERLDRLSKPEMPILESAFTLMSMV
ncbi:MAG: DNA polymerase III subunit delta' [Spartobacteria bacterium]|nr:DNA polymerase III subunit delta' [Spartobacteria bacterium]